MIWLERSVVVLTDNLIMLYDPFEGEVIETQKFIKQLVSHDFFSSTYSASTTSEHNSVICENDKLYFLEKEQFYQIRILKWNEIMDNLVKTKTWSQALRLAMELYEGSKNLFGSFTDNESRKKIALEKLEMIFPHYISETPKDNDELNDYITRASIAIDFCGKTNRNDLLFGEIFNKFCEIKQEPVFLEMLEPFILADKLTYLEPNVMRKFVDHYKEDELLKHVEHCIIHLNLKSMDIQEIEKVCKENDLFAALICIYQSREEYLSPLTHFFSLLESEKYQKSILGYLVLIYISRAFLGKSFPTGILDPNQSQSIKEKIANFLFLESHQSNKNNTKKYPYLYTLFQWDTKKTLSVLSILLNDSNFASSSPLNHSTIFSILHDLFIDNTVDPFNIDSFSNSKCQFDSQKVVQYLIM